MISRKLTHKILGLDPSTIANIAFLLVGLFLVMTVRPTETGLNMTLSSPNYCYPRYPHDCEHNSTMINITIDMLARTTIRNEDRKYTEIKKYMIEFINSHDTKSSWRIPRNMIVSLTIDAKTSYSMYINVYNEIKMAYNFIWETVAQKQYNRPYLQLNKKEQHEIFSNYPLVLVEY